MRLDILNKDKAKIQEDAHETQNGLASTTGTPTQSGSHPTIERSLPKISPRNRPKGGSE
jgi:hypothetical protein